MRSNKNRFWGAALLVLLAGLFLSAPCFAAGELDLDKAVKIGSGKVMVVEFTDPDCPYCRKAEEYFKNKKDVTRYVFFLPLKSHPASKPKVQYVLSAKDKVKAYHEVTSSAFDSRKLAEITPEGIKLQEEHLQIAKANRMTSTPSFIIYGRVIEGFDYKRLEELIK